MNRFGKFMCLILTVLLSLAILPVASGAQEITLAATQQGTAQPGDPVTLTISLPELTLAGGFLSITYDPMLFTLDSLTLSEQAEGLTMTHADKGGKLNVLLDAAENVTLSGELLTLTFITAEEIAPGNYQMSCTVPDVASFYALDESGTALPLQVGGCTLNVTVTDSPLPTAPVHYLACQEGAPLQNAFSVRLCAAVNTQSALSDYGFLCLVSDASGTRELRLAGSALQDSVDGGGQTWTAVQLDANALFCAELTLCATGTATICVTPFATLGEHTLYAGSYTITYLDGTYVKTE